MRVCGVCAGVHGCVWKSEEVHKCLQVCVLDEFSEYLLETRVNTSADFNTYPIRIFYSVLLLVLQLLAVGQQNKYLHNSGAKL